jgi:hypothetical protein
MAPTTACVPCKDSSLHFMSTNCRVWPGSSPASRGGGAMTHFQRLKMQLIAALFCMFIASRTCSNPRGMQGCGSGGICDTKRIVVGPFDAKPEITCSSQAVLTAVVPQVLGWSKTASRRAGPANSCTMLWIGPSNLAVVLVNAMGQVFRHTANYGVDHPHPKLHQHMFAHGSVISCVWCNFLSTNVMCHKYRRINLTESIYLN